MPAHVVGVLVVLGAVLLIVLAMALTGFSPRDVDAVNGRLLGREGGVPKRASVLALVVAIAVLLALSALAVALLP